MAHGSAARTLVPAFSSGSSRWTVRVVEPYAPSSGSNPAIDEWDDAALVDACLEGHKQAFDAIVTRHRRAVYQVCYRFAGNHEDASDWSQEVFVRAWKGLKNFKRQAALATWLYRIAVNTCLNRVAARKSDTESIDSERLVDHDTEDPRARLIRGERAMAVRRAIALLPDKQRATLILRAYQDLSHQEIAEILGSSVGAVKANFFHALANLKKILGSEP
jgi:RNA polymerase sigma-70 factor (ECF subfamily)